MARADPRPLPQARRPLTPGAVRREAVRSADVLVGAAATAVRVGVGVGRIALLPARLVARSPLVAPAVRAGTETLAAAGREAEARGLRRLEQAETGAVDLVAHRVLESPQLETLLREAAKSPAAQALVDDVVRSAELQRAMEEVLSGPAVRAAMTRQTRTLGTEVATGVRGAAERLDERLARAAARVLRRPVVSAPGYAGLASRGAAFAVDLAVTQGAALLLAAAAALAGSLLDVAWPRTLVGALLGAGWTLLVAGYFVLFWTTAGQTPGMRVLALRVLDGDGGRLGVPRALLRLVATVLALAPFALGLLPVLVDARRRALQDLVARSLVVRDQ